MRPASGRPKIRHEGGESVEQLDLSAIQTCELVAELKGREGVETNMIGPSASIAVKADGPCVVLVVID